MILAVWRGFTVLKKSMGVVTRVWRANVVSKLLGRSKKEDEEAGKKGD